jgi:hypothetical membrane protein
MLIISLISIFGAVVLYTSSPFRSYNLPLFLVPTLPHIWYPWYNFGYSIFYQYISDLGEGPSSSLFNTGIFIAGILTIAIFPTFHKPLGSTKTAKIGVALGIIAGAALACVGIFPEYTGIYHTISAGMFFFPILMAILVLSYANSSAKFFSKYVQWLGYIIFISGLVSAILITIFGPPPEWILLFLIWIWALPMGIDMLAKRKSLQPVQSPGH